MVAITVVLAAVVFVLVTRLAGNQKDETPKMTYVFEEDATDGQGGTITITQWTGPRDGAWTSVTETINGGMDAMSDCPTPAPTMGTIQVGTRIDCRDAEAGDEYILVWNPTQGVVLRKVF